MPGERALKKPGITQIRGNYGLAEFCYLTSLELPLNNNLFCFGRIGFKRSLISGEAHEQIGIKLYNHEGAFTSFKDLQYWVDAQI